MPNFAADSSAILSSPHSGWSLEMRRMKAMCSWGIQVVRADSSTCVARTSGSPFGANRLRSPA